MGQLIEVIRRLLIAANWIFFILVAVGLVLAYMNQVNNDSAINLIFFAIGCLVIAYLISILINWIFRN